LGEKWDGEVSAEMGRQLGRRLGTAVVLFHQAIAAHFGINATDLKCWDILSQTGPITAGRLAELTGMDTGSMTTVVDRLERAGFARREKDPRDRRRVIVRSLAEREAEIGRFYARLTEPMTALAADYTERELAAVVGYLGRTVAILEAQTTLLRKERARRRRRSAPPDR
jgi:DNA-binding MarR family transcriptional regulator